MFVSNCCKSELVYVVGTHFKLDLRHIEDIAREPKKDAVFCYQCGKCQAGCDIEKKP